uniref:Cytochrome b561 domain-containing protein n=1 Tax=Trichuris muris TaxID=70415 RepID=A0A5S6Q7F7_TRIMR
MGASWFTCVTRRRDSLRHLLSESGYLGLCHETMDIGRSPLAHSLPVILLLVLAPLVSGCLKHDCGRTKGCMFNPTNCELSKCQMIFTYEPKSEFVDFDVSYLFGSAEMAKNRYIAVGFSETQDMDGTSTVQCIFPSDDQPSVGLGYTVGHKFMTIEDPAVINRNVVLLNASSIDGTVGCSFSRRIVPTEHEDKIRPLNRPYYLLVAVGKLDSSGESLRIHPTDPTASDYPYISSAKTNFSSEHSFHDHHDYDHQHGNALAAQPNVKRILKKTHGSLMILGWWFFVASAILCARFLKPYKSERNFFGIKLWFLLHRTLNVVAIALIAVAFVLIFVAADGRWTGSDFPGGTHAILGMTASIGVFIQPIVSYFRCAPHDSKRFVFNWVHGNIGYLSWCCAAAAIFLITYPPFSYNYKVTDQFGAAPLALMVVLCASFGLSILVLEGTRIATTILRKRKSSYQTSSLLKLDKLPIRVIYAFMGISAVVCILLIVFLVS